MTFNEKEILRKISCSNVTAQVVVNETQSLIYCFEIQEGKPHIVCGQDIIANRTFIFFFFFSFQFPFIRVHSLLTSIMVLCFSNHTSVLFIIQSKRLVASKDY